MLGNILFNSIQKIWENIRFCFIFISIFVADNLWSKVTAVPHQSSVFHRSKAHSVVSKIKFSVELSNKNITQDPQGASRGRDVQARESTQTLSLSLSCDLQYQNT